MIIFYSCSCSHLLIFIRVYMVLWPRCSVGNQRFAHLTDNRATGSNNNNHFGQVQYPAKMVFCRVLVSLQLLFFPALSFPRALLTTTLCCHSVWLFAVCILYYYFVCNCILVSYLCLFVVWPSRRCCRRRCHRRPRRYISIYDGECRENQKIKNKIGRTIFGSWTKQINKIYVIITYPARLASVYISVALYLK